MRRKNLERQGLSTREREVLRFLANGKITAEIAKRSGVSIKTVHAYCERAKRKVGGTKLYSTAPQRVLLCSADMAVRFNEWLNGVGSMEMRYFDLQGKLIATQRLECTIPLGEQNNSSRSSPSESKT